MWTNKERGIANQLLEPEVMAFIEKVFVKLTVAGGKDIKEVLKKNVETPNSFSDILYPPILNETLKEMSPRFSVAVGVALGGLEK